MNVHSSGEPRVRLRERLRGATREAILDAAAEVFVSVGETNARIEDIAARAGVAVGTVYNYFEDRTALVTALLEVRTHDLLSALDRSASPAPAAAPARAGATFAADLERFVTALAEHFDSNRALLNVLLDEELHRGIDAKAATRRRTVLQEVLQRAEQLVAHGIRTHALQKADPAIYAALLVGMVRGVAMTALARRDVRFADSTRDIVRMFLNGASR